jgi:hypothetical protein
MFAPGSQGHVVFPYSNDDKNPFLTTHTKKCLLFFTLSSPAEGGPILFRGRLFGEKIKLVKKLHPHALVWKRLIPFLPGKHKPGCPLPYPLS